MKLSVVIPAFNAARTLPAQLDALAAQQSWDHPWEVLVADNGSRDDTRAIVARYRATFGNPAIPPAATPATVAGIGDPGPDSPAFAEASAGGPRPAATSAAAARPAFAELRLIDASARRGPAHARNRGAAEARGELLAFCDADDVVFPGWVAALGDALAHHEIVGGPLVTREINEPWVVRTRPWLDNLARGLAPDDFLPWTATASLGVRRAVHERIGGFDENLPAQEDQDYCWRATLAGAALAFVPEAAVHYRLRTDLPGIYRQSRWYARHYPALFRKFRPFGLRSMRVPFSAVVKLWGLPGLLLRDLPRAWGSRERMALWASRMGLRVGSLEGTIRHRYPVML